MRHFTEQRIRLLEPVDRHWEKARGLDRRGSLPNEASCPIFLLLVIFPSIFTRRMPETLLQYRQLPHGPSPRKRSGAPMDDWLAIDQAASPQVTRQCRSPGRTPRLLDGAGVRPFQNHFESQQCGAAEQTEHFAEYAAGNLAQELAKREESCRRSEADEIE